MSVHVDADGPVRVITIDRPEVRNAVDRPTAEALAAAFRSFEADPDASVAVLTGAGGTFCAGADLQAMSGPNANRVASDGDGPMGPSRMLTDKPVLAAVEGHAVAGGSSWLAGATCASRPGTRSSGCSAAGGGCRSSTAARSGCPA